MANINSGKVLSGLAGSSNTAKKQALQDIIDAGEDGALRYQYAPNVGTLVNDSSEEIALLAIEAMGSMGEAAASCASLLEPLLSGSNQKKKKAACIALGFMGPLVSSYADEVIALLKDTDQGVRYSACLALGGMKVERAAQELGKCLSDPLPRVVSGAIMALSNLDDEGKSFAGDVAKKLGDTDKEVKISAATYFSKFTDAAGKQSESIGKLLCDDDTAVRDAAVSVYQALGTGAESLISGAAPAFKQTDARFKAAAALAVGYAGEKAASYASDVATLLSDEVEDKSQFVYCVAGIEKRARPELRIPACAAAIALSHITGSKNTDDIVKLLGSDNPDVVGTALEALGNIGAEEYDDICPLLKAPQPSVKAKAASALGKIALANEPDPEIAEKVANLCGDKSPIVRLAAVEALGAMGDEGAAFSETILDLFKDKSFSVRAAAISTMGNVGVKGELYAPDVARMLNDNPLCAIASVGALANMGKRGKAFIDEVCMCINDDDSRLRIASIEALAKMDDEKLYLDLISSMQNDPLTKVSGAAAKILVGA